MRRNWLHFAASHFVLKFAPGHFWFVILDFNHGDAIVNGAHQRAQIATHAIVLANFRQYLVRHTAWTKINANTFGRQQINALMRAIFARDVAQITANAFVVINARHALKVQVKVLPLVHIAYALANKFSQALHAFAVKVGAEAFIHVLHNSKSVVHDGGAHLHIGGAKSHELCRVAPIGNAANSRNGKANFCVGGATLHHVQRDWFHGGTAVATV